MHGNAGRGIPHPQRRLDADRVAELARSREVRNLLHDFARRVLEERVRGDVASEPDRGARRSDGPTLLSRGWPDGEDPIVARLLDALPLVAAAAARDSPDGRPEDRPEDRAYVPTSHGHGMMYNWKIDRIGEALFLTDLDEYRRAGWRVGYLAPAEGRVEAAWDVLWVADDDSNFLWGVEISSIADLRELVSELTSAGNRILHVSPLQYSPDLSCAAVVVTWIRDGKYALGQLDHVDNALGDDGPRWGIWIWNLNDDHMEMHAGATTTVGLDLEALAGQFGFRPIWSCGLAPLVLVVLVADRFAPQFRLAVAPGADKAYDVGELLALSPDLVPHCIDCYAVPEVGSDDPSQFWWTVLLLEEPDLDPVLEPASDWRLRTGEPSLPSAQQQLNLIGQDRRILALTTQRLKGRLGRVDSLDPKEHRIAYVECSKFTPRFRTVSVVEDPTVVDPFLGGLFSVLLDLFVLVWMQQNQVPTFAIALRTIPGWQIRRGYTLAPRCYPDTHPESQFRVGSVSKLITNATLLRSLSDVGYAPDDFRTITLFGDMLPHMLPSVGDVGYPAAVLDTTVQRAITHTTGWAQAKFDPGNRAGTLVKAVANADLPLGYHDGENRTLLPLTRDVYYFYMLNRLGFGNNRAWDDVDPSDENEVGLALFESVGWRGDVFDNYSGWAVDILAQAVERLGGVEGKDAAVGREYAGYFERVRTLVLDPLEMAMTDGGFTRRWSPNRFEVPFRGGPYLEQTSPALASNPFGKTLLYEFSDESDGPSPYENGPSPPDADLTPRYVTGAYGGAKQPGGFRLEPVVAAGGWVSSAVDLARFSEVLESTNPVLPMNWVAEIARVVDFQKKYTNAGWWPQVGSSPFNFTGSVVYSGGFVSFDRARRRHLSGVSAPEAGHGAFLVTLAQFLAGLGY